MYVSKVSSIFCATLVALVIGGCSESAPAPDAPPVESDAAITAAPAPIAAQATPAPAPVSAQDRFWARLTTLCGRAYSGYLTVGTEPSDRDFGEAEMTMHVRDCSDSEIRIPFAVGENRSRTWIIRRVENGLTLKHRHLDEAGDIDEPNDYGGATGDPGTPERQVFNVDAQTRAKLPATQYNVWAIEVIPGKKFAYELQRPEEDRFFRVEFELTQTSPTPPPAWGEPTSG